MRSGSPLVILTARTHHSLDMMLSSQPITLVRSWFNAAMIQRQMRRMSKPCRIFHHKPRAGSAGSNTGRMQYWRSSPAFYRCATAICRHRRIVHGQTYAAPQCAISSYYTVHSNCSRRDHHGSALHTPSRFQCRDSKPIWRDPDAVQLLHYARCTAPDLCLNSHSWPSTAQLPITLARLSYLFFLNLTKVKLCLATATQNFKWVKINNLYLSNFRPSICKFWCLNSHFIPNNSDLIVWANGLMRL